MTTSLLRSSPAIGTSSYGAVPTLASTTLSGESESAFLSDSENDSDFSDAYQDSPSALHSSAQLPQEIPGLPRKRRASQANNKTVGFSDEIGVSPSVIIEDDDEDKDDEFMDDSPCVPLCGYNEQCPDHVSFAEVRASVSPIDDTTLSINSMPS